MILRSHFLDVLLLPALNVVSLGHYSVPWVQELPLFLSMIDLDFLKIADTARVALLPSEL